ncbi:MAG: phage major capsid protein [Bauldia sp.]
MPVPSTTYTEVVTTTLDAYRDALADNIAANIPLLSRLKSKGNTDPAGGGVHLLENLMYASNSTVKWYSGLETLDVSQSDVLTSASFNWKELNANVIISGLDKAQNSGSRESIYSLAKSRVKVAEITMMNTIGAALFFSNTENAGKSIGGLQHLIADLPTSGVVGGIDAGTYPWWRNQFYDFSANSVTPSSSTIQHAMNVVFLACQRNSDMIDLWVGDSTYFTYYLESLTANQRFMDDQQASSGFRALKFWGGVSDVIYDPNCPANHMYGLNTKYIHYRPHKDYNFVTLEDKVSINQDATVVPIYWKGNMTVSNRSLQGLVEA